LIAQAEDYHYSRYLLSKPLAKFLDDEISDPARRFYCRLAEHWPCDPSRNPGEQRTFTTTAATQMTKCSKSAVRGWLGVLHDVGAVELVEQGSGRQPSVWRFTDQPPPDRRAGGLPAIEDVFGESNDAQVHNAQAVL
jgi:hypothetical protein